MPVIVFLYYHSKYLTTQFLTHLSNENFRELPIFLFKKINFTLTYLFTTLNITKEKFPIIYIYQTHTFIIIYY